MWCDRKATVVVMPIRKMSLCLVEAVIRFMKHHFRRTAQCCQKNHCSLKTKLCFNKKALLCNYAAAFCITRHWLQEAEQRAIKYSLFCRNEAVLIFERHCSVQQERLVYWRTLLCRPRAATGVLLWTLSHARLILRSL